jgi:hypothetical protein
MEKLLALLPGRWTLITSSLVAILLPLVIWTAHGWGVAHHDKVQETQRADELHADINAPGTGLRDRLTACQYSLAGLQKRGAEQERAVKELSERAAQLEAEATRRIGIAQQQARQAERRAQSILMRQPAPDADRCQAAEALIREVIQ